ncbi:MAG: hypothetical protein HYR88_17100 [Verrucomicrobia bacterium]|nr:hypothetical protein [Verrucomicrobiota bacterium]
MITGARATVPGTSLLALPLLSLCWLALAVSAELPTARIDSLFPAGGRRGTAFEATAAGVDLDDPAALRFSAPGITAQFAPGATTKAKITIASNVPPGVYEARWVGRFGVSNPRIFSVGDFPELTNPGTNHALATAMPIALGTTINGKATAAKADFFRFNARQGQMIIAECAGPEIDSKLEVALWLHDKAGHEVARVRRDTTLRYLAPRDGEYTLRLHDFLNRGGDAFFYRLTVSTRPHIAYATPAAAQPGTNRMFVFHGWNLPGGVTEKDELLGGQPVQAIRVPITVPGGSGGSPPARASKELVAAGSGLDTFTHQVRATNGFSNPVLLSIASSPVQAEQEPNNTAAQAQVLSPPLEVSGLFRGRSDQDWYQFEGKKGQTWIVEVVAQRLGVSADPALVAQRVMRDAKGVEQAADVQEGYDSDAGIGGQDFRSATGDPSVRFDVKEDGVYRLLVRDQSTVPRDDIMRPYRLIVRAPTPDFRLVAMPVPPPAVAKDSKELKAWTSVLRKNGVIAIRVMAFRIDGFDQPIIVQAEGLPPGVRCEETRIAADAKSTLLLLHADETATNWTGALKLYGKTVTSQGESRRECRSATLVWSVGSYETETVRTRVSEDLALAVRPEESEPLSLVLGGSPSLTVAPGAKFSLPVVIRRTAEFPANLKLRLVGHPSLGAGKEIDVDKAATNAVFEIDLAQTKIPEGEHWLHVESQATFSAPRSAAALASAETAKSEADKALPATKDQLEKAKAEIPEAKKAVEKAEAEAKAAPEKQPAVKQAQESLAEKTRRVESLVRQVESQTQSKTSSEERIKAFAKREFNDAFYSMPVILKIAAPKTAQKANP